MILFFLICGLVLAYLLYRAFPRTTLAILAAVAIVGWYAFARNQQPGDAMATFLAAMIVVGFVADLAFRVAGAFRK